jgi:hypothetical protein
MDTKFITIYIILLTLLTSCNIKDKIEKQEKAQKDADFIIDNLDKSDVIKHFPESYFPKDQTEKLIKDLSENCDWSHRNGHFIDYTTIMDDGKNEIAFIYEYFLKCDSIRFILVYNIDENEPLLFKFQMEPLEKKNLMIIHTDKQLLK